MKQQVKVLHLRKEGASMRSDNALARRGLTRMEPKAMLNVPQLHLQQHYVGRSE